ncbi:MAG: tetratricopeptide repeat protein, partial [candidate division Zixibacteria bacterium]|nr:tetratricopeptide repeat protein [candidate division Zixibacteria bacterium]
MKSLCVNTIAIITLLAMWAPACGGISEEIESAYTRGAAMLQTGDLHKALPLLEKVEQSAPGYKSVHSYLVTAYKFIGVEYYVNDRLDEAIAAWQKALLYNPDNPEIKNYIARSQSESKAINKLNGAFAARVMETATPDNSEPKPVHQTAAAASITPATPASSPTVQTAPKHGLPAAVKSSAMAFNSGLAIGPAFPSGSTDAKRTPRWLFSGNVSLSSRVNPWGGRIEFIYGQSTRAMADDTIAGSEQYTSLFGASVNVVNRIISRPRQSI